MTVPPNHSGVGLRDFFEAVLKEQARAVSIAEVEREKVNHERWQRIEERFRAIDKARALQAEEYARRLHDLNGEYKRDRERQKDYVTVEKFESQVGSDADKVELALLRVNEKFEDYIRRYEARQREVDLLLSAQSGAAVEAKRAAEDQGRKANRNLAIATFILGVLVAAANWLGAL